MVCGSKGFLVGFVLGNRLKTKQISLRHMYCIDSVVYESKFVVIVAGEVNLDLHLKFYTVTSDKEHHL